MLFKSKASYSKSLVVPQLCISNSTITIFLSQGNILRQSNHIQWVLQTSPSAHISEGAEQKFLSFLTSEVSLVCLPYRRLFILGGHLQTRQPAKTWCFISSALQKWLILAGQKAAVCRGAGQCHWPSLAPFLSSVTTTAALRQPMALSSGLMPLWSTCSIIAPFSTRYCTWEKKWNMPWTRLLVPKADQGNI